MDYLFRGLGNKEKVRILGIDAKDSIAKICNYHQTLPLTTVAFARFLLAGAMIGTLEKGNAGISMKITCNGPIKSLYMQASNNGYIRGYVSNPNADLKLKESDYSIEKVIGDDGVLSISKISPEGKEFNSDVVLTKSNISQDIAYYFYTSEQIPTIIDLQVNLDDNGKISDAKGFLIQLMTGYSEEDIVNLENLKIEKINNLRENISSMFPDFEELESISIKDYCDCSKDKFLKGLATLSKKDLNSLTSEESIEVVCQFCKKKYIFTKEELLNLKSE